MSPQKLSPADRKDARTIIENHFNTLLEIDVDYDLLSEKILNEARKEFKKEVEAIKLAEKKVATLRKQLIKKLIDGLELDECPTRIKIDTYSAGRKRVCREHIKNVNKKNKPVIKKQRQAIAILQTVETRDGLAALFANLGII